jgi:hypothetical protein
MTAKYLLKLGTTPMRTPHHGTFCNGACDADRRQMIAGKSGLYQNGYIIPFSVYSEQPILG